MAMPASPKSKVTAVCLAILPIVGPFGISDFYLGRERRGYLKLGIVLFACGVGARGVKKFRRRLHFIKTRVS